MDALVGMLALAGLAAFIVWESFRKAKPPSKEEVNAGFKPGRTASYAALLIIAGFFVYFGIEQWTNPEHPPFTGRRAWFAASLYALFGARAMPVVSWALAGVCIGAVLLHRRRRRSLRQ